MTQAYSNTGDVPLALAVWLASDNYDYNDDPFTISATTLIKPLRQVILSSRIPAGTNYVPLRDMVANRIGAAIHGGIEHAWIHNRDAALKALGIPDKVASRIRVNPTDAELAADAQIIPVYMEQRLSRKIGKWTVTGKFDFIGEGYVQDFKSTSVFQYMKQVNNEKYALQGSIYRWLDPVKISGDELFIHYILKDWMRSRAGGSDGYPAAATHTQKYQLKSVQETQAYITQRLALIEKYWDAPEEDIPECTAEDLWRSEPEWKYYKNPASTKRSTKNFDNAAEAFQRLAADGNIGIVREIPGAIKACHYCPAFAACSQKDALVSSGDLIM